MSATKCLKCDKFLPLGDGPGRPRKFCSPECLNLARAESRRLHRRIEKLEEQLDDIESWPLDVPDIRDTICPRTERVKRLRGLISEHEDRLRDLIAADA